LPADEGSARALDATGRWAQERASKSRQMPCIYRL